MANRINKRLRRYGLPTIPRWYRKHNVSVAQFLARQVLKQNRLLAAIKEA